MIIAPGINSTEPTAAFVAAAQDLVDPAKVILDYPPSMGSEDLAFMIERVPGAYALVGNGDGAAVHNPGYMFNDETIPYGVALFARIVERG